MVVNTVIEARAGKCFREEIKFRIKDPEYGLVQGLGNKKKQKANALIEIIDTGESTEREERKRSIKVNVFVLRIRGWCGNECL